MTALDESPRPETAYRANDRRVGAWLFVIALVVLGPLASKPSAQPASRYALTAALFEHHSVDVTPFRHNMGVDHSIYGGEWRSDKPPGQPFFDVPFYAVGRVVGLRSGSYLNRSADLGMWWSTLWSSVVPFAVLVALMYTMARRYAPRAALPATVAMAGTSLLLPYGMQLYGHVLAACFAFAAWCVADSGTQSRRHMLAAGLLAGCAVAIEYDAAIVAAVILVVIANRDRRDAVAFMVGGAAPAVGVAAYQWVAFGAPWHLPYSYYAGVLRGTTKGGYSVPTLRGLADIFTGVNGLLLLAPIVVLGIAAAVYVARRDDGPARGHATVAVAIALGYVVLIAGWSGTDMLEAPGPRYLVPAIPFLVVPLALMWERVRLPALVASMWGAFMMGLATFTYSLVGDGEDRLSGYLNHVRHHAFTTTVWTIAFGRAGVVVYVVTIAAAAAGLAALIRTNRCSNDLRVAANLGPDGQREQHDRRPWGA